METRRKKRPRRWIWLAGGAVLMLLATIWILPLLIAGTGLKDYLIAVATRGLEVRPQVDQASLSWLAPIELRGIRVDSPDGQPLVDVESVRSQRSLLRILLNPRQLGTWTIQRPHLRVTTDGKTSNLHQLLGRLEGDEEPAADQPRGLPDMTVEWRDGVVEFWQPVQQGPDRSQVASLDEGRAQAPSGERHGGQAQVEQVSGGQTQGGQTQVERLRLDQLQGRLQLASADGPALALLLTGRGMLTGQAGLQADAPQSSDLVAPETGPWEAGTFQLQAELPADATSDEPAHVAIRLRQLNLAALTPLLELAGMGLKTQGALSADADVVWRPASGQLRLELQELRGDAIELRYPEQLGSEPIVIPSLEGGGRADWDGQTLTLSQFALDGNLAGLQADGQFSLAALREALAGEVPRSMPPQPGRLVAHIDLARAARAMPGLLHVRQDTRIDSGLIRLELVSRSVEGRLEWSGQVASSDLAAESGGRRLVWPQPLQMAFVLRQEGETLALRELECDCRFLRVTGGGSLDQADVELSADLNQLMTELRQFLDLEKIQLRGGMRMAAHWRRDAQGLFRLESDVVAENFQLAFPGGRPWEEPRLEVRMLAAGRLDEQFRPSALQAGRLQLQAGDDLLLVELTQPVDDFRAKLPVSGSAQGRLETWLARLQPLATLADYDAQGRFQLLWSASLDRQRVDLHSARLDATDLQVTGGGLFLREPRLELTAQASWLPDAGQWDIPTATVSTSAAGLRVEQLQVRTSGADAGARGQIAIRGDLQRLLSWIRDPAAPETLRCQGQLDGTLTLAREGGETQAGGKLLLTQFQLLQPPVTGPGDATASRGLTGPTASRGTAAASLPRDGTVVWQEPELSVVGDVRIGAGDERLELQRLELTGRESQLACRLQGTVRQWSGPVVVELGGELDYDLAAFVERFRGLVGADLQITGKERRTFRLQGPLLAGRSSEQVVGDAATAGAATPGGQAPGGLVPVELIGEATLGWQSVHYLGMDAGAGQMLARLHGGIVDGEAVDIAVNQGHLHLRPRLDLNQQPPLLSLAPGPVIQEIQISPEVCRGWLKYVAPLLADATRAEGLFSVDLQQAQLPLGQPERATTVGTLTIHGARVGPGPLAQQLLLTVEQIQGLVQQRVVSGRLSGAANWISMPPQTVDVRMVDGRVYHRTLQLVVDDVVISTRGSVGMDETISLEAQIPIREEWTRGNRWLSAMAGQTLRIPIRGTLSRPQVDQRVLKNLGRQALQQAAGQALQQELGRGLQQLFGPPPVERPQP